jgi:mannose-1-phosphate guanylyltransferase
VALLPADHHVPDGDVFRTQLARAFALAAAEPTVVTFGIRPDRPATGYGYIATLPGEGELRRGTGFVEKPGRATAEEFLAGGRHFWNSGMFVWNPARFAALADRHLPEVRALMLPAAAALGTDGWEAALTAAYEDCPSDSIDYAVMEKLDDFLVVPADFAWHDLGSWDAWEPLAGALDAGNRGRADLAALDSRGNVVLGHDRLVALIGVDDLVVVDTPDALLVCRKDQAQRIKELTDHLAENGRDEVL